MNQLSGLQEVNREPQIATCAGELRHAIVRLRDRQHAVKQRLEAVMRSEPTADKRGNDAMRDIALVPLAAELQTLTILVNEMADDQEKVINLLEL